MSSAQHVQVPFQSGSKGGGSITGSMLMSQDTCAYMSQIQHCSPGLSGLSMIMKSGTLLCPTTCASSPTTSAPR
ncbi:MAG: hypothetical protein P8Z41_00105 [Anaerolineales bacterium]